MVDMFQESNPKHFHHKSDASTIYQYFNIQIPLGVLSVHVYPYVDTETLVGRVKWPSAVTRLMPTWLKSALGLHVCSGDYPYS